MFSLFAMLKSLWIELLEHKMGLFWFLSLTEGTEFIVNSVDDDVLKAKYKITGALNDGVGIWYWLCL